MKKLVLMAAMVALVAMTLAAGPATAKNGHHDRFLDHGRHVVFVEDFDDVDDDDCIGVVSGNNCIGVLDFDDDDDLFDDDDDDGVVFIG